MTKTIQLIRPNVYVHIGIPQDMNGMIPLIDNHPFSSKYQLYCSLLQLFYTSIPVNTV